MQLQRDTEKMLLLGWPKNLFGFCEKTQMNFLAPNELFG